jgi:hypothetical protein
MSKSEAIDYAALTAEARPAAESWDDFVRGQLVPRWLAAYECATPWPAQIVEVDVGSLTYLFDLAPSFDDAIARTDGDDRVVAVWGRSQPPGGARDGSRMRGLIPEPERWSGAGRDRGHLVAHAAGGGLDLNVIPQSVALNRGRSAAGRRWRAMERHAAAHAGTPLLVRPLYADGGWVPAQLDFGLLIDGALWYEHFDNLS